MQYLLLGMAALLLFLLAARAYTMANPQVLARQLRVGAGVAALAGAGILVLRGMMGYALSLAALGAWLLWGMGGTPWAPGKQKSSGQTSRIVTDTLDVELDHDSGEIVGRVLQGAFAGRQLEELTAAEMARLWRDCRFADPQSAQVVEAYLDHAHPTWREDMARAEGEAAPETGTAGRMSRGEALEVLGLDARASAEDIRRAHRELIARLHPDRGGSTFLAAKINEAKDVLLGK